MEGEVVQLVGADRRVGFPTKPKMSLVSVFPPLKSVADGFATWSFGDEFFCSEKR